MNKFTFHDVNDMFWVTIPIYIYIYSHLSNDALFGECISRKKLLSFFISKLSEFLFMYWNSRILELWYHSDKAGRYKSHQKSIKKNYKNKSLEKGQQMERSIRDNKSFMEHNFIIRLFRIIRALIPYDNVLLCNVVCCVWPYSFYL